MTGNPNRFNGFPNGEKPLKRLGFARPLCTRLKPGVNEIGIWLLEFL